MSRFRAVWQASLNATKQWQYCFAETKTQVARGKLLTELIFVPKYNWYIGKIPLPRCLPTWRGKVIIDTELEMNQSRVLGMSLSVNREGGIQDARSGPGDFRV